MGYDAGDIGAAAEADRQAAKKKIFDMLSTKSDDELKALAATAYPQNAIFGKQYLGSVIAQFIDAPEGTPEYDLVTRIAQISPDSMQYVPEAYERQYTDAHRFDPKSQQSSGGGGLFGFITNPMTQVANDFNEIAPTRASEVVGKYANTIGDIGTAAVIAQTLGSAKHAIDTPEAAPESNLAVGGGLTPEAAASTAALSGAGGSGIGLSGATLGAVTGGGSGGSYTLPDGSVDWSKVLGTGTDLLGPALGYVGADKMADAQSAETQRLRDLSDQYAAYGEPYRQRLSDLYNDPNAFLTSQEVQKPVQMGTDMLSRSLSMGGNPVGSGNALQQLQSYSADQLFGRIGQEKDRLAGFGGLTEYNAAAPKIAANASGVNPWDIQKWNAVGAGAETLSNIFNPKTTAMDKYWERRARAEGY